MLEKNDILKQSESVIDTNKITEKKEDLPSEKTLKEPPQYDTTRVVIQNEAEQKDGVLLEHINNVQDQINDIPKFSQREGQKPEDRYIEVIEETLKETQNRDKQKRLLSKKAFTDRLMIPAAEERSRMPKEVKKIYRLLIEYSGYDVTATTTRNWNYFKYYFGYFFHWGSATKRLRREEKSLREAAASIKKLLSRPGNEIPEELRDRLRATLSVIEDENGLTSGLTIEDKGKNKWGEDFSIDRCKDMRGLPLHFKEFHKDGRETNSSGISGWSAEDRSRALLFPHEPCPQDVVQGGMGDCYFLSSLTAIARRDPKTIKDMMLDNGDGSVTVRFFKKNDEEGRYVPHFVTVDKFILKDSAYETLWVRIMEKAYAAFLMEEYRDKDDPTKSRMPNNNAKKRIDDLNKKIDEEQKKIAYLITTGKAKNYREAKKMTGATFDEDEDAKYVMVGTGAIEYGFIANGGDSHEALSHLLGTDAEKIDTFEVRKNRLKGTTEWYRRTKKFIWDLCKRSKDAYTDDERNDFDELAASINRGEIINAGTDEELPEEEGIYGYHAYSVTATYRRAGLLLVELRNPHGENVARYKKDDRGRIFPEYVSNTRKDGYIILEYRDFVQRFRHIYKQTLK
ncbi:MAG: hypothetical protein J6N76_01235 [Lachnospiraceae bacterium]|nr:hypothetical protein [Lachnospiraceae bacterium]